LDVFLFVLEVWLQDFTQVVFCILDGVIDMVAHFFSQFFNACCAVKSPQFLRSPLLDANLCTGLSL
jgi:hypothetical protein